MDKEKRATYQKAHNATPKARVKMNARSRKRKALKRGIGHVDYLDIDIFKRDNWICGICGRKIDRRFKYPSPLSKSIDHIIPLSKGGPDTPSNVQATHLVCNRQKRDKIAGQCNTCRAGTLYSPLSMTRLGRLL